MTPLSPWEREGPAAQRWKGEVVRLHLLYLTLPALRASLPLPEGEGR